jgi:hypothetical protein
MTGTTSTTKSGDATTAEYDATVNSGRVRSSKNFVTLSSVLIGT